MRKARQTQTDRQPAKESGQTDRLAAKESGQTDRQTDRQTFHSKSMPKRKSMDALAYFVPPS
jgi:hypothetical protein